MDSILYTMAPMKKDLLQRIREGIVIGDGAMGTMLYQRGAFVNTCFEELNLSRPDWIREIHQAYIQAGCDFIETNTFGANSIKLGRFGLADKTAVLNQTAAEIAKDAAPVEVLVAGSMGPSGLNIPVPDPELTSMLHQVFAEQARALFEGEVDFFLLETFSSEAELLIAVEAVRSVCELPILAQMTCLEHAQTVFGTPIEQALSAVAQHPAVAAVGLNCSVGPSHMLEALQRIRGITDKPISVQPNAGLPRQVDGRMLYMCTPEYMAEYAKRFFENGARIIGGCCGTTPEHIRQIAKAVRPLDRVTSAVSVPSNRIEVSAPAGVEPRPLKERSKLGAKLAAGQPIVCVELTPPRGVDLRGVLERARLCAQHGIDAVNIPDGPRASARLSPMVTAVKIEQEVGIETILHVCCRDKNLIGLQSDLLGLYAVGLRNVLIITGDPPKLGEYPNATAVFDLDSIALTRVVQNLNRGIDIAGNPLPEPLGLTVGVGANPVASDIHREIDRFRLKVQAGAEYAITQPVFDLEMFYAFQATVENCRIPILAGIWPFVSYKNAEFMANEVPGVVVPEALLKRMAKAKTRQEGRRIGAEIAHEMIAQLAPHVAGFAVSAPLGQVDMALAALGRIPISEL
ncbi:MAG: bifunctional homocysteine S-methyltransferase/methylenetetrahydrofolate reductase [Anaerohalosphaeraceae bacterium]